MKNRIEANRFKKDGSVFAGLLHLPYVGAVLSGVITLYMAIALSSYNPHDPSFFYYTSENLPVTNYGGTLGSYFAGFCFYMFGTAAYIVIGIGMYVTYNVWRAQSLKAEIDRTVALIGLLLTWSACLALHRIGATAYMVAGGVVGQSVLAYLFEWVDVPVAVVGLYSVLLIQLLLISRLSFLEGISAVFAGIQALVENRLYIIMPSIKVVRSIKNGAYKVTEVVCTALEAIQTKMRVVPEIKKEDAIFDTSFWQQEHEKEEAQQLLITQKSESVCGQGSAKKSRQTYKVPSLYLFAQSHKEEKHIKDESKQVAAVLEEKLSRFGVVGSVVAIKRGPVVTLFEYQPAIDTKVSKIIALEQDLALALEAISVRIVAPIPGTSRVGFEVSNKQRSSVLFGESIRSQLYQKHTGSLPLVLGQDTAGNQVIVDLADMPHVLVAGSTGSGKSVALNAMLISLLCRLTPDQLKLIIIDPKRLEFAAYHDIAHLLFPIITDPHKAAPVIRWLVRLMEERYQLMAQQGVRSIHDYKKMCAEKKVHDELPFIVLMIDELADLMMVAGKECEESIARLAQMARAAGIHLIIATQRPSVDVVTGVIKVNFPSRISFRLTSKIDSRTILDAAGAEGLLGKGDMLFMDAHSARMRRVHGAYVSDAEIKKVTDVIRSQQKVIYKDVQEVVQLYKGRQQETHDALLPEVLQYLQTIDQVSISLLQRRFTVGYNRAARLMELLELQGKVMPADGSKTRKVLH